MTEYLRQFVQWFAGGDTPYLPAIHCMRNDWFWIGTTIALDIVIIVGYSIIAARWRRSAKLAKDSAAARCLNDLRQIFIWCAVCGYAFNIMRMWWPAIRLLDIKMVILGYFTWRYVFNSNGLKAVYERFDGYDKLESDLAYYREIAETLPHLVATATPDGQADYYNASWVEYTGMSSETLKGDGWAKAVHTDDLGSVSKAWRTATANGQQFNAELRIRRHDGVYHWFAAHAKPMLDDGGQIIRYLGTNTDIHERKLADEKLKREADRLRTDEAKRRFFMNALSHDIRSPMNAIALSAQLAVLGLANGEPSVATESLVTIRENAEAATGMLNNLLEFARFSTNEKNNLSEHRVSDILLAVLRRNDKAAEAKGISLKMPQVHSVAICTDRSKLERIVSNLVENAIKFTSEGGITIESEVEGSDLEISVTDTGYGVSPEHQRLLFGEFFQVGNYERDRHKGFGMGLAIARVLAKQLGGDVTLASSNEHGSRFVIRLAGTISQQPCPAAVAAHADDHSGR